MDKVKILIVEDDEFYQLRIAETLSDYGLDTVSAKSVQDALKIPLDSVSGIISDVMLPNDPDQSGITNDATRAGFYSGVALIREFRKQRKNLPALLISGMPNSDAEAWACENDVPFISKEEGPRPILRALQRLGIAKSIWAPRAFIVHGHDEAALLELKDYLQNTLGWPEPVILREQASRGKTVIEKFEDTASRVDCVFVLLTPDDTGVNMSTDEDKRRSRQNVIFELGFFYAQIGRKAGRVIALRKGRLELPSDIQGIVWIDISNGIKAAGEHIRKEIAHLTKSDNAILPTM